jgi:hypothetical protein
MSDIYINEVTGKKIRVYERDIIHVYDHDDPRDVLDFRDTAEGVASWCVENLFDDDDGAEEIEKAYEEQRWLDVIELSKCRHCEYEIESEWVVEEVKE